MKVVGPTNEPLLELNLRTAAAVVARERKSVALLAAHFEAADDDQLLWGIGMISHRNEDCRFRSAELDELVARLTGDFVPTPDGWITIEQLRDAALAVQGK